MTTFPTLLIGSDKLEPQGAFAVAQAEFLHPEAVTVSELDRLLSDKKIGVVAHYYMDAELQGVLTACSWPHVYIADSLKMADAAVTMAEAGCVAIVVLGVDFMSENVRAVLDAAGHEALPVYRLSSKYIGCSLAESAEKPAYAEWLGTATDDANALHVVYINTSLQTKATAHQQVPTITCTSSNVVQTILQAADQIPDLAVFYGPDTYMGHNLQTMFKSYLELGEAAIRQLHPAHGVDSLKALLERFSVYEEGNCVVHHMFGAEVVRRVQEELPDAFYTAHLEVPGEMFALAVDAARDGRGVVGSTSNILGFITDKVDAQVEKGEGGTLSFVLGTEAGMVTAIVDQVQKKLRASGRDDLFVEIVFPVAAEAVSAAPEHDLGVIPGVPAGEGCTPAGGCATCPYMKMNSLDALFDVIDAIGTEDQPSFEAFKPKVYSALIGDRTAADLGTEPILHMRHFQRTGRMPDALVNDVLAR